MYWLHVAVGITCRYYTNSTQWVSNTSHTKEKSGMGPAKRKWFSCEFELWYVTTGRLCVRAKALAHCSQHWPSTRASHNFAFACQWMYTENTFELESVAKILCGLMTNVEWQKKKKKKRKKKDAKSLLRAFQRSGSHNDRLAYVAAFLLVSWCFEPSPAPRSEAGWKVCQTMTGQKRTG